MGHDLQKEWREVKDVFVSDWLRAQLRDVVVWISRRDSRQHLENAPPPAWNVNRTLAKINYRIHTDAIQPHLSVKESAW